jgi:hypothetical protein
VKPPAPEHLELVRLLKGSAGSVRARLQTIVFYYPQPQPLALEAIIEHPQVISIHEYELKEGVEDAQFERAFQEAEARGLFELPGMVQYYLVKGIRGVRRGKFATLWVYESQKAWEQLWGPIDQPIPKERYPQKWLIWEDEVLVDFLSQEADRISYTTYLVSRQVH